MEHGAAVSRFLPGFTASVDYFRINLADAIGDSISAQEIVSPLPDGNATHCAAITSRPTRSLPGAPYPDPPQPAVHSSREQTGAVSTSTRPIDPGEASSFTLKGVATRYIENLSNTGIVGGSVAVNTVGANGG